MGNILDYIEGVGYKPPKTIPMTDNAYCVIPTIELREIIKQLQSSEKVSRTEIAGFITNLPYM